MSSDLLENKETINDGEMAERNMRELVVIMPTDSNKPRDNCIINPPSFSSKLVPFCDCLTLACL